MARDGIANIVVKLEERGFDPRRVGSHAWEARCPGHRSADRGLPSRSAFGAELRRIAPQLRVHGIAIHFERKREGSIVSLSFENRKTSGSNPNTTDL